MLIFLYLFQDKYFCIHLMFICFVGLLSIGTTALGTPAYNLACTLGTLGIFTIIQLVCGIVTFLKVTTYVCQV